MSGIRIKYNAPTTLNFTLLACAILVADIFLAGSLMPLFTVGTTWQLENPFFYFTLVSHVLGHQGLAHLLGNLTLILLLGPIVEEKYGSRNLAWMMLATAFITGVLNVSFFSTGLLGASGIVFMLILLASFANVQRGEIPVSFILVAVIFLGGEILQTFSGDEVSQFAHVIGGACGSIFGFSGVFKAKKLS